MEGMSNIELEEFGAACGDGEMESLGKHTESCSLAIGSWSLVLNTLGMDPDGDKKSLSVLSPFACRCCR